MSIYVDGKKYEDGVTEDIWPDGARFAQNSDGSMNLLDSEGEEFAFWNWWDDEPGCIFLVELAGSPRSDASNPYGLERYRLPQDADRLKSDCAEIFNESKE